MNSRLVALFFLLVPITGAFAAAPNTGDEVWAQWRPNSWHLGTVDGDCGVALHIAYMDGDQGCVAPEMTAFDRLPSGAELASGARVLALWTDGRMYPGRIEGKSSDGRFPVRFDDGDARAVRRIALRPMATPAPTRPSPRAGAALVVQVTPNNWQQATLERSGACSGASPVRLASRELRCVSAPYMALDVAPPSDRIPVGTRVLARWTDGKLYPALVAPNQPAEGVAVNFDDGASLTVPGPDIRVISP